MEDARPVSLLEQALRQLRLVQRALGVVADRRMCTAPTRRNPQQS